MKQCPECQERFDDNQVFCDQDGAALVNQIETLPDGLNSAQAEQTSSIWITGLVGGLVGVVLCLFLYALFVAPGVQEDRDTRDRRLNQTNESAARFSQSAPAPRPQSTPLSEEEPSPEEEQPSPSPSPAEVGAAPAPAPPALNNGPIATGTKQSREGERAIIKMRDGSSVEVDAAWEDSQGVWYRRSGLVSFVEKSRVEAITDVPRRAAAKAEGQ